VLFLAPLARFRGLRRAGACSLALLACCAEHLPTRQSAPADAIAADATAADAVADGAAPASDADAGESSPDGTLAESGASVDDAMSAVPPDSGDSPVDATAVDATAVDPDAATDATSSSWVDADAPAADVGTTGPFGPCNAIIEPHPIEGYNHVPFCAHVTYATKPPSSGDHYPVWAAYMSYASAIPEGTWVHNLEHGAVVVSYDCPGGCAGDVAAAQTWIDALPNDFVCNPAPGAARVRVLMTPDPHLDVKFAASAWGWTLRADCFDPAAWTTFYQDHFDHGREVICASGMDYSLGVPDGCGE
jgi:hypothetical protein